jgi:dipeptidyl aminopeptidase/acylaminoacyl peptidase
MLLTNNSLVKILYFIIASLVLAGCSVMEVSRTKNVTYRQSKTGTKNQLNIFTAKKTNDLKPVLIYIHGGSWHSGKKSLYNFLGNRFARKGIVTVTIDYPLSPEATYHEMAKAAAQSVKWVKAHIEKYNGDPQKIFISGHSAGGHLAALIGIEDQYFNAEMIPNPIKGIILIDAAGLDMHGYLKESKFEKGHSYLKTFTNDPVTWKEATPLYHLHPAMPPMLIYRGLKTYPSIEKSHEKFINELRNRDAVFTYHVQNKKHVPMITQFFFVRNPRYKEILDFMQSD